MLYFDTPTPIFSLSFYQQHNCPNSQLVRTTGNSQQSVWNTNEPEIYQIITLAKKIPIKLFYVYMAIKYGVVLNSSVSFKIFMQCPLQWCKLDALQSTFIKWSFTLKWFNKIIFNIKSSFNIFHQRLVISAKYSYNW